MPYHIGVDLGGTNIKAGIIDDDGGIIRAASVPTALPRAAGEVADGIAALVARLISEEGITLADILDIGIGCPGTCNTADGIVEYSNNLAWRDFPLCSYITRALGASCPVYIENDANAAALGEFISGSAKGSESAVVITIGTGIGSGAIINGRLITGQYYGGGEFGHMVIVYGGKPCTCGRKGCFEAYASATGLINLTKDEMERSPQSLMHALAAEEGRVSARTAFDAMRAGDGAGGRVVELFLDYLACGVTNCVNALQPQVLSIGGGVCNEGDTLLIPLRERVKAGAYGYVEGKPATDIRICTLGNDAGIIGAAMLGKMQ